MRHRKQTQSTSAVSAFMFLPNFDHTSMQTTDEDLLFQTSAQIAQGIDKDAKRKAASSIGHPIQVGKVIEVTFAGRDAFIAESGWQARRLDLRVSRRFVHIIRAYSSRQTRHYGHIAAIKGLSHRSRRKSWNFPMAHGVESSSPDRGTRQSRSGKSR